MTQANGLLRLNLGCGLRTVDGWINVDGSWNARLAKHPLLRRLLASLHVITKDKSEIPWSAKILIHDIRKPLPFPDGSANAVYASHVLEHLYVEEGRNLIQESFRVLAKGGVLRVVVPDLNAILREYLGEHPFGELSAEMASLCPADRVNQRLLMRWPSPSGGSLFYRIYNSWQDFHTHKWMYDSNSLAALIESVGFAEVQPKTSGESRIENVDEIEEPSRILNGGGICVEGVKP
ncbi:MAG TPA: methyltransferase domain-containing protein [Candidatus Solibacter sp.]|nr:methyltransferase domain-containing protein [Candidatus Solibacter sp.]